MACIRKEKDESEMQMRDLKRKEKGNKGKALEGLDGDGAITVRVCGLSPDGGVFGVQTPIENLDDSGAFVLPLEGGIRFDIASMKKGVWSLYCDFIYCQAPVAAIETPKGAFGVCLKTMGSASSRHTFRSVTRRPHSRSSG